MLYRKVTAADERGYILLETVLALPCLVVLLSVLGGCILWAVKTAAWQRDDWEVQEELRYVMGKLVEDASRSESAAITREGKSIRLYYRKNMNPLQLEKAPTLYIGYSKWGGGEWGKGWIEMVDKVAAPMTGGTLLANLDVTDFCCTMETDHILHIHLAGKSLRTGHEFSLETAVYIRGRQ